MNKRSSEDIKHFNENGGWKNLKNTASEDYAKLNNVIIDILGGKFYAKLEPLRTIDAKKETEHLIQETMVDIWRGIDTFDPSKGAVFTTWAYKIGKNRLSKFLRNHQESLQARLIDTDMNRIEVIDSNETEQLLHEIKDGKILTARQEAILLDLLDRRRSHEIGETYSLSPSSIRKIKREIIAKLRAWFRQV